MDIYNELQKVLAHELCLQCAKQIPEALQAEHGAELWSVGRATGGRDGRRSKESTGERL